MEVMSAPYPASAPQAQTARDSRPRQPHPAVASQAQHGSAPASQESDISAYSSASSAARTLHSNASNVSQFTNWTDYASQGSTASATVQDLDRLQTADLHRRAHTPEDKANGEYPLASPMSITSPVAINGTKRTASGHVKNSSSIPSAPMTTAFPPRKTRTESISSTGSRAGELAASLKARLGYAMAKVQNGWEHKSIGEVEHLASQKMFPGRYSMSHVENASRPSGFGLSNGMARVPAYAPYVPPLADTVDSPPSKRHSAAYGNFTSGSQCQATLSASVPRLQPPADIRPGQGIRPTRTPPMSSTSTHTSAMSPPRTPVNNYNARRPPTVRTDTQTAEAERDALQALTQLGSPHNSQVSHRHNASQASSSQASPLRSEFMPGRRVNFARGESDSSAAESTSEGS